MNRLTTNYRDLTIYQRLFLFQQAIYVRSKSWPREEQFALANQIRRSSRSVGAYLAEAWSKRQDPAYFRSKLTDADGELQETSHWLRTAEACGYMPESDVAVLGRECSELGRMLGSMIRSSDKFAVE